VRYWKIHSEIFSISSLVKISITWRLAFIQFFTWDYIINRTLHGGPKIRLLSSRVKTIFYSLAALVRKILFSPLEDKSHIFAPPCNILYIRTLKDITKYQWDIFCDVFTSEDVDADSTDQNECWFVFCDCVVLLTDTCMVLYFREWWKQYFTHSLYVCS
jgi:hypothetical protein